MGQVENKLDKAKKILEIHKKIFKKRKIQPQFTRISTYGDNKQIN